jgi:hypothetical protein
MNLFNACESSQESNVETKLKQTKQPENVKITEKEKDNTIGGLDIKIIEALIVKTDVLGIKLKLENKSNDSLYPMGNFSATDTNKNVLDQEYPIEDNLSKQDIINLSNLPEGAKWEGFIFFKTNQKKIILLYDDMMGNKKKFNVTIK